MGKIKRWACVVAGTFLMGVAYGTIFGGLGLVTGGFSGIAIMVKGFWGIPLWFTTAILNMPVFALAWRAKGRRFVVGTIAANALFTLFLGVLPDWLSMFSEGGEALLLAAVYGGCLAGLGLGLVMTAMLTTGGTDMAAAVICHYIPGHSVVRVMQMLDAAIVVAGACVFGVRKSLYAGIAIYVAAKVSDRVIDGSRSAKAVYVISDLHRQIAKRIMDELGRGGTCIYGRGMYSGDKKTVILCVVSRKQAVILKKIIYETDANAFVIISDVREALGLGFVENVQ